MEPVIIRNNFFEERPESIEGIHGPVFGIDLDDGASNYDIYNNITKNVSMKLREGARRTIHNNIWYNSVVAPCFHVGNEYNHDRYFGNITVMSRDDVYSIIAPPARGPWLEEIDNNCFFTRSGTFTASVHALRGEKRSGPSKAALYDAFKAWRNGGPGCSGRFDVKGAWKSKLTTRTTRYSQAGKQISGVERVFDTKVFEGDVWGLEWFKSKVSPQGVFPQYYKLIGNERVAISAADVSAKTQLPAQEFELAPPGEPCTSPAAAPGSGPVRHADRSRSSSLTVP